MGRHKNTILRIQNVRELAMRHYESGNQAKCFRAVWKYHIYPIYPMCYRTFLNYVNEQPNAQYEDKRQLSLFE